MSIQETWRSFYGEQVPIAFLLRQHPKNVWLRIHSLPHSKRYAGTDEERHEISRRYNTVAEEILGANTNCALFFPRYSFPEIPALFAELDGQIFADYQDEENVPRVTMFYVFLSWQKSKFDAFLRCVADDEIRYVLWMNLETGEFFAPYDGGADLFFSSTTRHDEMRARWSHWLPQYPERL